jgi:internalin A
MHATHQFFLTKRSLYLLVLNAREGEQDANVEYGLRIIESFGGASPVIVVINKVKDHPFDLNRRGLQEKFSAIRDFVQTDCEEPPLGIAELRRAIERETDRLEHLRDPFPASWFTIKDRLASLRENFITYEQYQDLCAADGLKESTSQNTLVGFLHDLGIVVNFRDDPRLADTHVLNPHWVTNGIYKILNAETVAEKKGELSYQDLPKVLDPAEYPRSMHRFLLDLMEKFELCYEFYGRNGEYLVPELLGKEEPELKEFTAANALRFEYHYNILPEGLLPRFIVRSRALIQGPSPWRTGAILAFEGNRAMVKADIQDRKVSIAVIDNPAGRRRLLAVIRSDFEHIHRSIARLQAEEMVPVPEHPGVVVPYTKLLTLEKASITKFPDVIGDDVVELDVKALLSGVEEPAARPREPVREASAALKEVMRVVFSYSHKDEELRDQLETHLKLLQRQGVISTWHDRKIKPGDEWEGVIDENFQRADLILLLVSSDFVASDYCYEIEMRTALERHEKVEAKVVPIILRACQWRDALFGKLQALPKDGKPVMS